MQLFTWFFSFITSMGFSQKQEQSKGSYPSHFLIEDDQGRWVSPGLIPDNFLDNGKTEKLRLQLAQQLELDEKALDFSLASLSVIDPLIRKEKIKPLIDNFHLYLPLLSYFSQVIIRERKGELLLKKSKEYTDLPEQGYPNVRVPTLWVHFADEGEANISRLIGKEFSQMFHYHLTDSAQTILEEGVNRNYIFKDHKTGKKY
ncbi:hypothetical protein QNI19_38025 [Cytophagaceae bacterium DM2B3-1]|uniref:Uncharacterized protein n=1 Tax=Xanthocytophaga flava TaxID=3048013 RepID=A0ABT7CYI1_9BACT|nr:hypothetical protein [Xanthocytophaga flavus]MDJ1498790.1 hypothetical protein [Xanthocytophaga flavus]